MGFYSLIVGALCVWRITHLLSAEDGPGDVLVHLRRHAGNGSWGRLLDGSQVSIDLRDAPSMAAVPHLRRV